MRIFVRFYLFIMLALTLPGAALAAPTIDKLTVQGYMKQNSGAAVTDGTYNIAFGVFQNGLPIWGKTIAVTLSNGLMSATLTGVGGDLTALPAATGMNANYSAATLNAALLTAAASGPIMVRVYAVNSINGANPQFDINVSATPTSYVAETSKGVVSGSVTLAGIAASAKTNSSAGAADAGKLVALDAAGLISTNMIPNLPASQISSGQVGLGNGGTGSTTGSITGAGNVTYQSGGGNTTIIGNNTGASVVTLQSGTGGIAGTVAGTTGNVAFTAGTTSGNITLTPGTTSGAVSVGSALSTGNSTFGNAGGASVTTIQSGTGNILLSPAGVGLVRVTNGNGINLIHGAGSITLNAPNNPTSYSMVFPGTAGGASQVLMTDGTGNLSWTSAGSGTVTNVSAGSGLLGGPITAAGSLSVDTGTTAGKILQLNASSQIPAVDGFLLTNVNASKIGTHTVATTAPAAGNVLGWNSGASRWEPTTSSGITTLTGDVTATGPGSAAATIANNAVTSAKINSTGVAVNRLLITDATTGATVAYSTCAVGEILQWTASGWSCASVTVLLGNSGVTAGTYGSATQIPQVSVNAQGRVTALTNINIAFPVTSVSGRTGAVTLVAADISGLGTASTQNYGTSAGDLVQLDGTAHIPVALLPVGIGTLTQVVVGTGMTGGGTSGVVTVSADIGTTANKLLQLNASAYIPAVDGHLVTNLNAVRLQSRNIAASAPSAADVLTWNGTTAQWEPQPPGSAPVSSVAGKTGAVTLDASDIVSVAGKYFTYLPNNVACTNGQVLSWDNALTRWVCANDANSGGTVTSLNFGGGLTGGTVTTAGTVAVDTGTTAGKILQLNGSAQIPAVDGSLLTNVSASRLATRTVSATAPTSGQVLTWNTTDSAWEPLSVAGMTALTGDVTASGPGSAAATIANNAVTAAKINTTGLAINRLLITDASTGSSVIYATCALGEVLQWSASGWVCSSVSTGTVTNVATGTGLTGGPITFNGTLSVDVGTTAGKILQLTGSAQVPAIDGFLVTNVNAVKLQARNVAATAPTGGQVLGWNGSASQWEPTSGAAGSVTNVAAGTGLTGGPISSSGTLNVDIGTTASKILQVTVGGQYPAVDGHLISNLNIITLQNRNIAATLPTSGQVIAWNTTSTQWEPSSASVGTVVSVDSGTGLTGGPISSNGTLNVDVGTTASKILQVTAGGQYPAVDGHLISNLNVITLQNRNVAATMPTSGQVIAWNTTSTQWEPSTAAAGTVTSVNSGTGLTGGPISSNGTLNVDVGTAASKILQVTAGGQYPAVDGHLISNLNVITLQNRNVAVTLPTSGQVIAWNNISTQWEPSNASTGTVVSVDSGTGLTGGPISSNGTLNVDVGTAASKILQVTAGGQYPAVDGHLISNLNVITLQNRNVAATAPVGGQVIAWNTTSTQWEPSTAAAGTVTSVNSGTGLTGGPISSNGTLNVDVGTAASKILQVTAGGQYPAVDGHLISNLNVIALQNRNVAATLPTSGQVIAWNTTSTQWEPSTAAAGTVTSVNSGTGLTGGPISANGTLNVDVGTAASKILQVTAGGQYPAVDGHLISNLNVITLQNRNVAATAPADGQVIAWNTTSTQWEPSTASTGTVVSVNSGTGLTGGPISSNGTLNVDVGTAASKILQVTAGGQYPAVDGHLISNLNVITLQNRNVAAIPPTSGQVISWNTTSTQWEPSNAAAGTVVSVNSGTGLTGGPISSNGTLNVDVGTTASKILQVTVGGQYPAVDGHLISNLNVIALQNRNVAATLPTSGQVIAWNNTSTQWEPATAAVGSVTSVALAMPSIFAVSNSPVTTTGTLTATLNTQNANLIFAGPTSGGATVPTFRALVAADLPNPTATTLGGVESIAASANKWINAISTSGVPSLTQPAFTDISGSVAASQMPALSGDVTTSAGAVATTLATNVVSNAKFRQGAALSVVGNGTNATANVADIIGTANQVLVVNSAGTALAFGQVSLTAGVTGVLPVANGGTGTATGSITGTTALTFAAGGSNQNVTLTPSGSGNTILNGKVGIGSTTPAQALDVAGSIRSSAGGFVFPDGSVQTSASPGTFFLGNLAAGTIGTIRKFFHPFDKTLNSSIAYTSGRIIMPVGGTVRDLFVHLSAVQTGGVSTTFTVYTDSGCSGTNAGATTSDPTGPSASAITFTINAAAAAGNYSDTTHTASVSAGDCVSVRGLSVGGTSSAFDAMGFRLVTP